jgi:hypothetical protein
MSKLSTILVSLFLLTAISFPVFAKDLPTKRQDSTSAGTIRKPLIQQNINTKLELLKENIASKTAALKVKLEAFKDKRKAIIAERVNTNLNTINQNQVRQMQKHLDTMTNILNKLEARVNRAEPDIKNTAAARAAIISSRASIATASAATLAQSQKDYTIVVTSETRIKADAVTQRNRLHEDLLSLRKLVIVAKQSVGAAIRIAKTNNLEDTKNKEGTESGQQ